MNINYLVSKMLMVTYRPILFSDYSQLKQYVDNISKDDEERGQIYAKTMAMSTDDIKKIVVGLLGYDKNGLDIFDIACVLLKIYEIERETITMPNIKDLKWERYKNLSLNSSVSHYSSNDNFIAVQFNNYRFVYLYTYSVTGMLGTENMKLLAKNGCGLGSITSTRFKDKRGFNRVSV